MLVDVLLRVRLQVAGRLRAGPELLDLGVHGVRRAGISLAQVAEPLRAVSHAGEHVGIGDERFHAWIPGRGFERADRRIALQLRIGARPCGGGRDFLREHRRVQDVRDQRIGIKSDRCQHRVELALAEAARSRILAHGAHRAERDGQREEEAQGGFHASNVDPCHMGCCINV